MLKNLLCWFLAYFVIVLWFMITVCLRYFTKIHWGLFMMRPRKKEDTMCLTIYFVSFGYIWSLNSDLSKHYELAISLICIEVFFTIWRGEKTRHYVLAYLLWWLMVHLVIEYWFKITPCVSYFTKVHSYFFTIWPVNEADTIC